MNTAARAFQGPVKRQTKNNRGGLRGRIVSSIPYLLKALMAKLKDLQKHVVMIGDQHSIPQTLCVKVVFGSAATWKVHRAGICGKKSKEGLENFELEKVIQAGKIKIIMFVRRYHPADC
jgi:hypothetical protein